MDIQAAARSEVKQRLKQNNRLHLQEIFLELIKVTFVLQSVQIYFWPKRITRESAKYNSAGGQSVIMLLNELIMGSVIPVT